MVLYPIGATKAAKICAEILLSYDIPVVDHPTPEVTHLLLDVPAFDNSGALRSGAAIDSLLSMLPPDITVIGGKLDHPALEEYRKLDLLTDDAYLARNAAITADCALKIAGNRMDFVFCDAPALVIGWGRIGKCLARMLKSLGCQTTVAARKPSDRAMLEALGYRAVEIDQVPKLLPEIWLLFNTVPAPVLTVPVPKKCIALELASTDGICGENIVTARALPGKCAPESAGKLMAERIINAIKEDSV